jgi:hypothetical protein
MDVHGCFCRRGREGHAVIYSFIPVSFFKTEGRHRIETKACHYRVHSAITASQEGDLHSLRVFIMPVSDLYSGTDGSTRRMEGDSEILAECI